MNKFAKMMMLNTSRRDQSGGRERRRDREDYETRRQDYGVSDRFRDRDGREHYDDGRFAPMSRGGYSSPRSDYGMPRSDYMEPYSHYPVPPYVPPVYEHGGYPMPEIYRPVNKIGFSVGGEMERLPREAGQDYRTTAAYEHMDEMSGRRGSGYSMGRGRPEMVPIFTRQMAEEWTQGMENEDGSRGPHWTLERIKQEMDQRNIKCDLYKFWAVINSIYSDDVAIAKKHSVNTMDYYIDRAKAWLEDKDAVKDKAAAYYQYVVQH